MDEVVYVNERQDERMEGIEEGALSLVSRVVSVEEENCQLREVQQAQEERIVRDRGWIQELERSVGTLRTLINSLVETVGLVLNDVAWIHHWFLNNRVNCWVSGPLYPKFSTCSEGARLTQLVQLVTAGR